MKSVIDLPPLYPTQERALELLAPHLYNRGSRKVLALPTGGGKTRVMQEILMRYGAQPQLLMTGRKGLFEQTKRVLAGFGVDFGCRADGHTPDFDKPIQLAMIQTEYARRGKWPRHVCDIVHVDEPHSYKGDQMRALQEYYAGSTWIGWTATPLGLGEFYDEILTAGTTSDVRACGAIVPAYQYGVDEPDLAHVKRTATGEYKQGDVVKAIMSHQIVGRVMDHWQALNPLQRPTMLFGPGVAESLYFAEQFWCAGIPAAHIDGDMIWINGEQYVSDDDGRERLAEMSRTGEVKIVCNRFVLREGIDWPWIEHGIFATIFGALTGYLQSGGRILRQHFVNGVPQLERVTIQDHGGNWHRHGSLNSDREWSLERNDYIEGEAREERLRNKTEREPICCPQCFMIRTHGAICPGCQFVHTKSSRIVVQKDGRLREMEGDIYKPRRLYSRPDAAAKWEKIYHRAKNSDMTFSQARGLYCYENNYQWPSPDLPLMPRDEYDLFRKVKDVPRHLLNEKVREY